MNRMRNQKTNTQIIQYRTQIEQDDLLSFRQRIPIHIQPHRIATKSK